MHVVAGILHIGPVAVTTSLFPRFALSASTADGAAGGLDAAKLLHRVTRTYGILALSVPLVGLALAAVQGRLGEIWITAAMVLTAAPYAARGADGSEVRDMWSSRVRATHRDRSP